ncbi:hypothetical protein BV898_11822 [Hypsibius exemplaris]|uniref:Leucine-rich repeat-containing protein 43 n=1 Tax=Hypsibius exemplaris TaxID=2072580 RepID=A0A1W0WFE5_HYPEX|nr:hypothetical protein BV898_11822 [Hypsibius exemplaris]
MKKTPLQNPKPKPLRFPKKDTRVGPAYQADIADVLPYYVRHHSSNYLTCPKRETLISEQEINLMLTSNNVKFHSVNGRASSGTMTPPPSSPSDTSAISVHQSLNRPKFQTGKQDTIIEPPSYTNYDGCNDVSNPKEDTFSRGTWSVPVVSDPEPRRRKAAVSYRYGLGASLFIAQISWFNFTFPLWFNMAVLHPNPVPYQSGPEHLLPFPALPSVNFNDHFIVRPAPPKKAFEVFQEKLKELGIDQFPYHLPSPTADKSAAWMPKRRQPENLDGDARSLNEVVDEKKSIMDWKSSPWYKECRWSDDFDQLHYKLLKAKKPLRLQTVFQQFESLNLCNEEITEVGSQLLMLKNLKTLSLADNRIRTLNMEILPSGLKVISHFSDQHLELYGNAITTLHGFSPKFLRHLGLAANGIVNPLAVFAPSDLRSLVSIDLGENLISNIEECTTCLGQFPQLHNLRAAGNPISLIRSYQTQLVNAVKPRLLCIDGDEISEEERLNYKAVAMSYETFAATLHAPLQCILLFTIDDILGAPLPTGYIAPAEQTAYPLTKWAYTVEIAFPGNLLPTKPALPPPTAEMLKAEEKAKKAKAAKTGKKGHHSKTPPLPVEPVPEPQDPFYANLSGMQKVTNDGFDWTWNDPLPIGQSIPLLTAGETPMSLLYEYLRRGMKVKIFQKRILYTPLVTGKKAAAKAKLPKGQKPDLWAVPLESEVADSIEIAQCTIPLIQLLHGDPVVKFQTVLYQPAQLPPPVTPGLKKKHPPPAPSGKEGKSRLAHTKPVEGIPLERDPMVINMRVTIHHDRAQGDLLMYPPEIPPYVALEPLKPRDTHSHNSTPKSLSPDHKTPRT